MKTCLLVTLLDKCANGLALLDQIAQGVIKTKHMKINSVMGSQENYVGPLQVFFKFLKCYQSYHIHADVILLQNISFIATSPPHKQRSSNSLQLSIQVDIIQSCITCHKYFDVHLVILERQLSLAYKELFSVHAPSLP